MSDLISRQAAIETIRKLPNAGMHWLVSAEAVFDALLKLPSAQPQQRWIPVAERLPKQGQKVICQCRASIIDVLELDANGDWYQDARHCYMSGFVIAWMPLQAPFEPRESEG